MFAKINWKNVQLLSISWKLDFLACPLSEFLQNLGIYRFMAVHSKENWAGQIGLCFFNQNNICFGKLSPVQKQILKPLTAVTFGKKQTLHLSTNTIFVNVKNTTRMLMIWAYLAPAGPG